MTTSGPGAQARSISIVMPTLDKERYLPFTLAALRTQTFRDFQLIVVDDGGSGAAADILRRHATGLDVVYAREPHRGRAGARNAGLQRADGELVVFLDDDRIACPGFLAAHHDALTGGDDQAGIGWKRRALTIWLRDRLPLVKADFAALQAKDAAAWQAADEHELVRPEDLAADAETALARIDLGDDLDNHSRVLRTFPDDLTGFRFGWTLGTTGNLAVPAAALRAVGGFDEGFTGWGIEDVDLCYRLHREGIRFRVTRGAVNYHQLHPLGPGPVTEAMDDRRSRALANAKLFCAKHDTVETYLYGHVFGRAMTIIDANSILDELTNAELPAVEAELIRLYRVAAGDTAR